MRQAKKIVISSSPCFNFEVPEDKAFVVGMEKRDKYV